MTKILTSGKSTSNDFKEFLSKDQHNKISIHNTSKRTKLDNIKLYTGIIYRIKCQGLLLNIIPVVI